MILAAYDGMKWIDRQVNSIFAEQDVGLDIYVSVDMSADDTYEYCLSLSKVNQAVKLLPYGKRFGGAAPNFYRLISEVDFSDYDFVAFSDQDDIWHPDKIKRACDILNSDKADVYSSNVTAFWVDGREALIDKAQPQRQLDHFFEAAGPGCTYVFKQAVMLELQAFVRTLPAHLKGEIIHDWLSYAFCRDRGYRWYIDPVPSMRYRQHENNQIGTNSSWAAYKKRFALIRNKTYRNQVETVAGAVAPDRLSDISNRFFLLRNIFQLRRRPRDRFFLFIMLLLGIY